MGFALPATWVALISWRLAAHGPAIDIENLLAHRPKLRYSKASMFKEIRRILLVGAISLAPLALTVYLFVKLFAWFDELFHPITLPLSLHFFGRELPGLGIILGLVAIFITGLIAPSIVGRQFIRISEWVLHRLPLARWIYSGVKQIFDSFSATNLSKFNRVVLVHFPHKDALSIGFVTQEVENSNLPKGAKENNLAVFVPTTPNPTSGYIIFVAEEDTLPLTMSVEEALKFIISVGFVRLDSLPFKKQKA